MTKKTTFQLYHPERRAMMRNVSYLVQSRLAEFRLTGPKHAQLARELGVPRTRISEAYHRTYLNETLLKKLISHGYLSLDELLVRRLNERQKAVLSALVSENAS